MEIKPDVLRRSIESLLKLQDIDAQLFKLNAELNNLPPELVQAQAKRAEADKAFKIADRQFRDIDRERRALELRLMTLTEDVKKAENKRRELRNTKEEFSANKEVDNFRKKMAEIKAGLEERTGLAAQRNQLREEKQAALAQADAVVKELAQNREGKLGELKEQVGKLETQRDSFIQQVDDIIFSLYERVQRIRKGSGIALLKDEICTGCFVSVPPQARLKLSKLNEIITCSSCSRILFPYDEVPEALRPVLSSVEAPSAAAKTGS